MERPFNPKFSISKPIFKPKYVDKYHQPQRSIDESLVSRLFLLLDEGNIRKISEFLIDNRFLVNVRNGESGDSPLHIVIKSTNITKDDKLELVKLLLSKGASPVAINKLNITPIHLAAQEQLIDIVKILLDYRADPNALDSNNMNTLHYAILGKNIKCPIQEDKYIIPKKKTQIITKELRLVQEIADSVNKLFFNWPAVQRLFKNIFNNINNFDVLYADKIADKRESLLKNIAETIKNRGLTEEEKRSDIIKKIETMASELENMFNGDIGEALGDMSKDMSVGTDGSINIKSEDIEAYNVVLKANITKAIISTKASISDFVNIDKNFRNNIIEIKEIMKDIRWMNRTLVVNYSTKYQKGQHTQDDNVIVPEDKLNNLYDFVDISLNYFNLFMSDEQLYNYNVKLIDNFDININNASSSNEVDLTKYIKKPNKLFFDSNTNKNNFFNYEFNSSGSSSFSLDTLPYTVKSTFLKYLYIYDYIIHKHLQNIEHNIGIIDKFVEKSESWNIAMHILPSILVSFYSIIRIIKIMSDYLAKKKDNFLQIKSLITATQKETIKRYGATFKHVWIYDYMHTAIDMCQEKYANLEKDILQYFIKTKNFIKEYNSLVEIISQLEGVKELESYYNDWINKFLDEKFTGSTDYFCNDLNIFKINLSGIKKIDDIPIDSTEYMTRYFNPILNTKFSFYPADNTSRNQKISDISNSGIIIKYPDNTDRFPFVDKKFMEFNPYNISTNTQYRKFNFGSTKYNGPANREIEKRSKNCPSITSIFGNHIKLLKYYILYFTANATYGITQFTSVTDNMVTDHGLQLPIDKLFEYKQYMLESMKLTEAEFGNADKKLLVEIMSETFNNFVEFLVNQVSKKIAYNTFEKYRLIANEPSIPLINTTDNTYMPIFQTDDNRNILNIGLKSKLTVEDIKNLNDTYDEYIDEAQIREPDELEKNIVVRMADNFCLNFDLELIKLLKDNRASLSQKDNSGKMPINYALELKNLKLIESLSDNFSYYKNSPSVLKYFKDLLTQTIEELVTDKTYSKFYSRYEAKLLKQLDYIPEINTNILSSVNYTIPMFMTLLNSMLFTNIINYDYGYTYESLNELLKLFGYTKPDEYYGPIVCQILNKSELTDYSKVLRNSKLQKQLDIIQSRIKDYENSKKELERDVMTRALFDEEGEIDSDKLLEEVDQKLSDSEEESKKLEAQKKSDKIQHFRNLFSKLKIKNTSSFYNGIFLDVINNGEYNSTLNVKLYKALWQKYSRELKPQDFITNIHLKSINYLQDNINDVSKLGQLIDLYKAFNKISKDYAECPLEYNITNPHLQEVMKLITHTTTHTIFNYMYITITSMIIKQLESTYSKTIGDSIVYQEQIVKLLKEILKPEFVEYMFRILPERATKIILNIYDGDDDPDRKLNLDGVFNYVSVILSRAPVFITPTKETTPLIDNLKTYVIIYYKEYTKVIVKELFNLSNNFFKHLSGIHQMLEIHEKLI